LKLHLVYLQHEAQNPKTQNITAILVHYTALAMHDYLARSSCVDWRSFVL